MGREGGGGREKGRERRREGEREREREREGEGEGGEKSNIIHGNQSILQKWKAVKAACGAQNPGLPDAFGDSYRTRLLKAVSSLLPASSASALLVQGRYHSPGG